jgi:hypothetical protein
VVLWLLLKPCAALCCSGSDPLVLNHPCSTNATNSALTAGLATASFAADATESLDASTPVIGECATEGPIMLPLSRGVWQFLVAVRHTAGCIVFMMCIHTRLEPLVRWQPIPSPLSKAEAGDQHRN